MNLKGAWNVFSKLWKDHSERMAELDVETRCDITRIQPRIDVRSVGIRLGMGMFNFFCSMLPPKAQKLASWFGFDGKCVHFSPACISHFAISYFAAANLRWSSCVLPRPSRASAGLVVAVHFASLTMGAVRWRR